MMFLALPEKAAGTLQSDLSPNPKMSKKNHRVASAYFLLGIILMSDSFHTDNEKVLTKASYYIDKHLKKRIKCYFALN